MPLSSAALERRSSIGRVLLAVIKEEILSPVFAVIEHLRTRFDRAVAIGQDLVDPIRDVVDRAADPGERRFYEVNDQAKHVFDQEIPEQQQHRVVGLLSLLLNVGQIRLGQRAA